MSKQKLEAIAEELERREEVERQNRKITIVMEDYRDLMKIYAAILLWFIFGGVIAWI